MSKASKKADAEKEVAAQNQEAAGNNYTGPDDIETTDGKPPFVGAPDDPRNNVPGEATEDGEPTTESPDSNATSTETASNTVAKSDAASKTKPVKEEKPKVNFEHRFAHFKDGFLEEMHELAEKFKADCKALVEKFHNQVHGAE